MSHTGNLLLDSLGSPSLLKAVLSAARKVEIPALHTFWRPGAMPSRLVFLTSGVAATTSLMQDGKTPEIGLVGREGLLGHQTLFSSNSPITGHLMLGRGKGFEVSRQHLLTFFAESTEFRERILEFAAVQADITARLVGCNVGHQIEHRLARWLSMVSMHLGKPVLEATQETISALLGVQRASVSVASSALESRNIIRTRRGIVSILDPDALAAITCNCCRVCCEWKQGLYRSASSEREGNPETETSTQFHVIPPLVSAMTKAEVHA